MPDDTVVKRTRTSSVIERVGHRRKRAALGVAGARLSR